MHELSIAMSVLEVVEEEAERRGVTVSAVRLKVGPLAGVIKVKDTVDVNRACYFEERVALELLEERP